MDFIVRNILNTLILNNFFIFHCVSFHQCLQYNCFFFLHLKLVCVIIRTKFQHIIWEYASVGIDSTQRNDDDFDDADDDEEDDDYDDDDDDD